MLWPFSKKKKPPPKQGRVPGEMVDLHCHFVPGLENDGPADMGQSLDVLHGLAELGFTRIVATPHYHHPMFPNPDPAAVASLIAELEREGGDKLPALSPGAEVMFDEHLVNDIVAGNLPTIGPARVFLVEFPYGQGTVPNGLEEAIFRLGIKDISVILAHVERYPDLQRDLSRVERLQNGGALIQINLMSIAGKHGPAASTAAWDLLDRGHVDIVASDLHHSAGLPIVGEALNDLARWSEDELRRLVVTNPAAVLEGRPGDVDQRP